MSRSSIVEDILVQTLENLYDEFKPFKKQLSATAGERRRNLSSHSLRGKDELDVVTLLMREYGEKEAAGVVMEVLNQIHCRDHASRLKARLERDLKENETPTRDFRAAFKEHTKNIFEMMKFGNTSIGEGFSLTKNYSKLLICKEEDQQDNEENDILTSGRKHLAMFNKPGAAPFIYSEALFDPVRNETAPTTIVLKGPAGIGKTVTVRKMILDWASGNLYQDRFDFAFYINCREVNLYYKEISLNDLVQQSCPSGKELIEKIFAHSEKVLFIIDGFDELKYSFELDDRDLCYDRSKRTTVHVILMSLLRRTVAPTSSVIVTTRPTALEKLMKCFRPLRIAEILGFSEEDRKDYFRKFFGNEANTQAVLSIVKDNDLIFNMCFLPIVCQIVCSVFSQQMKTRSNLGRTCNTTTSIYIQYLSNLQKHHYRTCKHQPLHTTIQGLCSLALSGIWNKKILFEEHDLQKHGLHKSENLSAFLNSNLLQKDIECQSVYSFIHLSFQELFAAMHYVLTEDKPRNTDQDVTKLLENCATSKNHFLMLTVRFLFGLLNEKRRHHLEELSGCKVSDSLKRQVLEWVKQVAKRPPLYENQNLEIFHWLYEMEEEEDVRKVMENFQMINLRCISHGRSDYTILAFCLKHCQKGQSLHLYYCDLEPAGHMESCGELESASSSLFNRMKHPNKLQTQMKSVMSNIKKRVNRRSSSTNQRDFRESNLHLLCEALKTPGCKLNKLELQLCRLGAFSCQTLSYALCANTDCVSELDLSDNQLRDTGAAWLCAAMAPANKEKPPSIRKLTLAGCSLTLWACHHFSRVLSMSKTLEELNLSRNEVTDRGIKHLSVGLKNPACNLQKLVLAQCQLTDACCLDFSSVLSVSQCLVELDLCNNFIGYPGAKQLCDAVKDANCKLQTLRLDQQNVSPDVRNTLDMLLQQRSLLTRNEQEMDAGNGL